MFWCIQLAHLPTSQIPNSPSMPLCYIQFCGIFKIDYFPPASTVNQHFNASHILLPKTAPSSLSNKTGPDIMKLTSLNVTRDRKMWNGILVKAAAVQLC